MAAAFGGNEEGTGSQDAGGGACYVKKGELGLFCEKHNRSVKLYCEHHKAGLCHTCAIKDHQKPCKLDDIDVVLAKQRSQILKVKATLEDSHLLWKGYVKTTSACVEGSNKHLKLVEDEVHSVVDDALAGSRKREEQAAKLIEEEADEEIRKITEEINAKREARLKQCHDDAEKRRQLINGRRRELMDDVTSIADKTRTKLEDLQRNARDAMQRVDAAAERVELLLDDDKELLKGAQQLITSLADTLGEKADVGVVEDLTRKVKCVRFIEGRGNARHNGRIGGYDGKWERSSSVEIPRDVNFPRIVGYTSNDDVIISDVNSTQFHTYTFNVRSNALKRVIESDGKTVIASCALLDEDTIVCGKHMKGCTGESLPGCISMYNKQWELIRDITLPRNTSDVTTEIFVAIRQDGMIIAAEPYQKSMFVINPNDGCIIDQIRCKDNIGWLRGVLATGDVIAHPDLCNIIDRRGAPREITHSEKILNCGIDILTDELYVVHWDERRKVVVVDQMSGEGYQDISKYIPFPIYHSFPNSFLYYSTPVITASGDMIVSNGRECLVFKKRFVV